MNSRILELIINLDKKYYPIDEVHFIDKWKSTFDWDIEEAVLHFKKINSGRMPNICLTDRSWHSNLKSLLERMQEKEHIPSCPKCQSAIRVIHKRKYTHWYCYACEYDFEVRHR